MVFLYSLFLCRKLHVYFTTNKRFWRTIKYDYLYLYEHKTIRELYVGIKSYLNFYNSERGHSSLGYSTPNEVFENSTFEYKKIA